MRENVILLPVKSLRKNRKAGLANPFAVVSGFWTRFSLLGLEYGSSVETWFLALKKRVGILSLPIAKNSSNVAFEGNIQLIVTCYVTQN